MYGIFNTDFKRLVEELKKFEINQIWPIEVIKKNVN